MSKLRYIILVLAVSFVFSALACATPYSNYSLADKQLRAEFDFLNNKLYKVNRYMDTLEDKLIIAEKRKNGRRITQLNNLLTKGHKRITRIKKLILNKHEELAALYEKAENKPNYVTIYSDLAYNTETEQAYEREVLDVKPPKKEPVRPKETKEGKGLLSDIQTSYNISADTQAPENGEINAAQVAASFNANKGPVYFQYTHSRNYQRMVDYYGDVMSEFDGMVNNRVEVGVSFSPDPEPANINLANESALNEVPVNNSNTGVSASSVPY